LTNQFSVKVKKLKMQAACIFLSFVLEALQHTATERLGEILRFRKFQGRSADLLRIENRPSAPPGTFPARGGALIPVPTNAAVGFNESRCAPGIWSGLRS
jgi:hypothetical protein